MIGIRGFLRSFKSSDSGVTAIEYGLIAALIAVAIIAALRTLGSDLTTNFEMVSSELGKAKDTAEAGAADPGGG